MMGRYYICQSAKISVLEQHNTNYHMCMSFIITKKHYDVFRCATTRATTFVRVLKLSISVPSQIICLCVFAHLRIMCKAFRISKNNYNAHARYSLR